MTEASYVLLGTGARFTEQVVDRLLQLNLPPRAYIQPHRAQPEQQTAVSLQGIDIEAVSAPNALQQQLQQSGIPFLTADQGQLPKLIQQQDVDFLLVACWPRLLDQNVINAVKLAAVNLHPSLLPRFRGIDPIRAQLASGDTIFGISLHLLSPKLDTGDIVLQQSIEVSEEQNYAQIEQLAASTGADLFAQAINTYHEPGWALQPQP